MMRLVFCLIKNLVLDCCFSLLNLKLMYNLAMLQGHNYILLRMVYKCDDYYMCMSVLI